MANKVFPVSSSGRLVGYGHHCPGCGGMHVYYTVLFKDDPPNPVWGFDGNMEHPTFTPSMRVSWSYGDPPVPYVCHYNITNGQIIFHSDSTHQLKGQTVSLPDSKDSA